MSNQIDEANRIIKSIIKILDEKAHKGSDNKVWFGFQNGNGEEVGKDIERLIIKSKKYIQKYE